MKLKFKIWLVDDEGKTVFGKGGFELLRKVQEKGSIAEAAKEMGVSYKFAWEYVKRVNASLGDLEVKKGGRGVGGTKVGEKLAKVLEIYERAEREVNEVLAKYEREIEEVLKGDGTERG
ncbi:MAG: winged helix-turn-helix domain-containing protein [Thermoprotei archaeon]